MAISRIIMPGADFSALGVPPVQLPYSPEGEASLLAWYDAQDAASIIHSSGAVSSWLDKTGNWPMSQATAGRRPTYSATGWDGVLPSISFDGLSDVGPLTQGDRLENAAGPYSDSQAVFIVAERAAGQNTDASAASRGLWNSAKIGGASFFQIEVRPVGTDAAQEVIRAAGAGTGNSTVSTTGFTGKSLVSVTHADGADLRLRVNGGPPTIAGSLGAITGAGASIGGQVGTSNSQLCNRFAGEFAELVVLNAVPSTDLRQKIEGYLAWKWLIQDGLAVDHPYRTVRPAA